MVTFKENQFWIDLSLVTGFLCSAFASIWIPDRLEFKIALGIVLVLVAVSLWRSRQKTSTEKNPNRPGATAFAWKRLTIFTLIAAVALLAVSQVSGVCRIETLSENFFGLSEKSLVSWLRVKLPTVLGQQIMLQLLLIPLLIRIFKNVALSVFLGALIFSALHFPNPALMLMTLLAGIAWNVIYQQTRRLSPVVVSHCVLAMLAAACCGEYAFSMRVGPGCLNLFPKSVDTDAGTKWAFPECVVGTAERLVQQGDQLIVEGWAYDPIHHGSPTELFLKVNDEYRRLDAVEFKQASSSKWKNAQDSGFVEDVCFAFSAKIPIGLTQAMKTTRSDFAPLQSKPVQLELFAANANGNLSKLGRMGDLDPLMTLSIERPVVLFPVEVDGRIDLVRRLDQSLQIKGWTADLKTHAIPDRLFVELDGELRQVEISQNRTRSPGIARALDDPGLVKCGFDVTIERFGLTTVSSMRYFVIGDQRELHPIELTPIAQERIALEKIVPGEILR